VDVQKKTRKKYQEKCLKNLKNLQESGDSYSFFHEQKWVCEY